MYYRKVIIRSKDDLPKDNEPYVCYVQTSLDSGHLTWMPFKGNEGLWEMVIWYLFPVEQSQQDEIIKQLFGEPITDVKTVTSTDYHDQFELSDEEIYNQANLKFDGFAHKAMWTGGAKWR